MVKSNGITKEFKYKVYICQQVYNNFIATKFVTLILKNSIEWEIEFLLIVGGRD
jgi:hypothetical protein